MHWKTITLPVSFQFSVSPLKLQWLVTDANNIQFLSHSHLFKIYLKTGHFSFVACLENFQKIKPGRALVCAYFPLALCLQSSGPTLTCHTESLITTKYYFKAALTVIRSNWVLSTNTNYGILNLDFSWYFNEVCVNNPKSSVSPAAELHIQTFDAGTMC